MLKLTLVLLLFICAYTDVKDRKIYNVILLPALALGFGFNLGEYGLSGLEEALWGMFLGGGLLIIPYLLGGMGAGDVKLLAAVGAIGGTALVWRAFLFTALIGGILAVMALLRQGALFSALHRAANPMQYTGTETGAATVPYGLAIAMGGLIALI